MRRRTVTIAATLCLVTAGAAFAHRSPVVTRTIYGRVIDAGTGRALENVSVFVQGASVGAFTRANGAFRVDRVPTDLIHVAFRHPCYFAVQVAIPANPDVEIEIGLPFDASSLQRAGCGGLGARSKRDTAR